MFVQPKRVESDRAELLLDDLYAFSVGIHIGDLKRVGVIRSRAVICLGLEHLRAKREWASHPVGATGATGARQRLESRTSPRGREHAAIGREPPAPV